VPAGNQTNTRLDNGTGRQSSTDDGREAHQSRAQGCSSRAQGIAGDCQSVRPRPPKLPALSQSGQRTQGQLQHVPVGVPDHGPCRLALRERVCLSSGVSARGTYAAWPGCSPSTSRMSLRLLLLSVRKSERPTASRTTTPSSHRRSSSKPASTTPTSYVASRSRQSCSNRRPPPERAGRHLLGHPEARLEPRALDRKSPPLASLPLDRSQPGRRQFPYRPAGLADPMHSP
jgi:hypothetical protein